MQRNDRAKERRSGQPRKYYARPKLRDLIVEHRSQEHHTETAAGPEPFTDDRANNRKPRT